jgi:tetratricopeptide (TPR) repeat protein
VIVFVADDFAAWLVGVLADAGRRKLTTVILGDDQGRALRAAATAATLAAAAELCPGDPDRAEQLAMVVSEVFRTPVPGVPSASDATVLEALRAGVGGQLTVLHDPAITGTVLSSADVLEVPEGVLATTLTRHLLRQIIVRGARGGPLFPLASQLNDDVNGLRGQRIETVLGQLASEVRQALTRLDTTHSVAAVPTALAQLPIAVAGFTGRDNELALLVGLLDPAGTSGPAVVSAVAGMAGVGKTALAVQAGHVAFEHGWFGGGVLFIDLQGYDKAPVQPDQALDALLRALGVPDEHIPPTVGERAGLYRSVLAQISDAVLLIVDNASTEAQVRPLLPGAGPHRVLITSRTTLAGLYARLVDIGVLDDVAAIGLLDKALRLGRPDDDRISAAPSSAARLAGLCGGLPLALQITAALLKADPSQTVSEMADVLDAEVRRLTVLRYDDGSGTSAPSAAAAFEVSYRQLEETASRVFRLLSVNPGPDVSTAAIVALTDQSVSDARAVISQLVRAHLIESAAVEGRWRMHDLLRLYALQVSDAHADADGREQARDRLLRYYLATASAADEHLRALQGSPVPAAFTNSEDALTWLDVERPNLVAAVTMAANIGRDQIVIRLPLRLSRYLSWRRHFGDWLSITLMSRDAAVRKRDQNSEAAALNNLGLALFEMRRFDEAITAHQDAAAILRETGSQNDEGMALNNLGLALRTVGRFDEAITAHRDAAAIFRETGDQNNEAKALTNLGSVLLKLYRFDEAISTYGDAGPIFVETGDLHGAGMVFGNLGVVLREAGRFEKAIIACKAAVKMFRAVGDRHGEGTALGNLGIALREAGRFDEAITAAQEGLALSRETGDRHGEGAALTNLGSALMEVRRFEEAIVAYRDAAAIFRETGDQHLEEVALGGLDLAQREVGPT